MATFTYVPSYSSDIRFKPRVLKAQFGDGYEQNVGDGINANPKNYSLTFNNVDLTTADNIVSFFETNQTDVYPFDWTDPAGVAGRYMCDEWSRRFDGAGHASISCTFREVFW